MRQFIFIITITIIQRALDPFFSDDRPGTLSIVCKYICKRSLSVVEASRTSDRWSNVDEPRKRFSPGASVHNR